jgi:rare lipoprotein A
MLAALTLFAVVLQGIASYYVAPWGGHTCAMRYVPMGTIVRVHNLDNGRRTWCRVNDRGPFVAGRIIDLNSIPRDEIDLYSSGLARVEVLVP